jgi:hypothetical protein
VRIAAIEAQSAADDRTRALVEPPLITSAPTFVTEGRPEKVLVAHMAQAGE